MKKYVAIAAVLLVAACGKKETPAPAADSAAAAPAPAADSTMPLDTASHQ